MVNRTKNTESYSKNPEPANWRFNYLGLVSIILLFVAIFSIAGNSPTGYVVYDKTNMFIDNSQGSKLVSVAEYEITPYRYQIVTLADKTHTLIIDDYAVMVTVKDSKWYYHESYEKYLGGDGTSKLLIK